MGYYIFAVVGTFDIYGVTCLPGILNRNHYRPLWSTQRVLNERDQKLEFSDNSRLKLHPHPILICWVYKRILSRSVPRYLAFIAYRSRNITTVPLLTPQHRTRCFNRAVDIAGWILEDWQRIIRSNISRFHLFDERVRGGTDQWTSVVNKAPCRSMVIP